MVAGTAGLLVLAGIGIAILASRAGSRTSPATVAAVTRAFAARRVVLQIDASAGLAPGVRAHPLGFLTNQPHASTQGLVEVVVLRSTAEALGLARYSRRLDLTARDPCGDTGAVDLERLQTRNGIATFSACDYADTPARLATASVRSAVAEVMRRLGATTVIRSA